MRGRERLIGRAFENVLDRILSRSMADDHDPLAGIVALEVVEEGRHALQCLVVAFPVRE